MSDPLQSFIPAVRSWFLSAFGEPTPPQAEGWPAIQRGEHALILAPTGSGKTLAAFLWAIDSIFRLRSAPASSAPSGVRLLYISPLKALNNDVERNLRAPLEGIRAAAARIGQELPPIHVAVRTGDTPQGVRSKMVRRPPDILITTPESLYLMLTSPRAREMFRTVGTVILDEIHTLCGTKRGVHLSLTLERLAHLAAGETQRIGLSATVRPLEEAASFLGGQEWRQGASGHRTLVPRPVTVIDTGYQKALDLRIVTPVSDFRDLPGDSIWPSIIPLVLQDIRRHRSTLIFANSRRLAERTADRLNAQLAAEESEEIPPGSTEALAPGGLARDRGIFALGASGPIRAHHGSMSREARRRMEEDLKAGRLPALVGTSSLELGIDIGAIDLVVQLQSPRSVSQGLQRIGRSGHLVGQMSRGRIYATHREDLVEAAAVVRGMLDGEVEASHTPQNPLDVLSQQIVAMVGMDDWDVGGLFDLVRQAYAYRTLSRTAFEAVLDMLAGIFVDPEISPQLSAHAVSALKPRIAWDRPHDRLAALPGTRLLAVMNPGTIPDTGMYGVYLSDGATKVGELDEEFVFETRTGDVFLLGSNVWRVIDISENRILVGDAAGAAPRMPFWHGDYPWRPYESGVRLGRFKREVARRLQDGSPDVDEVARWLVATYAMDDNSARAIVTYVRRQLEATGVVAHDELIVAESFRDAVGEPRLVVHSTFGGRINGAWALALQGALADEAGIEIEAQANDDGIIFRFPGADRPPPHDILQRMSAAEARRRILQELPNSAVFGAQFRMNAARALLLPRARGSQRTPFWLQRLKAKDLLAIVHRLENFPIVAETYRDCLRDVLDLEHLEQILERIAAGTIRVVPVETRLPSPVASGLLFNFMNNHLYEWDAPKAERQIQTLELRQELIEDLLASANLQEVFKPEAVTEVLGSIQHTLPGYQARSVEELALVIRELGDLSTEEVLARCTPGRTAPAGQPGDDQDAPGRAWLAELAAQDRAHEIDIPAPLGAQPARRWVAYDLVAQYRAAFPAAQPAIAGATECRRILTRFLLHAGPVTRQAILARYAFDPAWLAEALDGMVTSGELLRGRFLPEVAEGTAAAEQYCRRSIVEQIHRRTLALLRREIQPVSLSDFAAFQVRWQHLHPAEQLAGRDGLRRVLQQLQGLALPARTWEHDVLPARVPGFRPADLEALCQAGELVWVLSGTDPRHAHLRYIFRGQGAFFLPPAESGGLSPASAVHDFLKAEGASFLADIQAGLGLGPSAIRAALVELALAGSVTCDSLASLHAILGFNEGANGAGTQAARGISSSLAAELAAKRRDRQTKGEPFVTDTRSARQRPSPARYQAARRRVAQRLSLNARPGPAGQDIAGESAPWPGRWSLVHRAAVLGPPPDAETRIDGQARSLLARYGIVTRQSLAHETSPAEWPLLYAHLQRMEMRGEARRGYFVRGLPGAQFALPDAVERLRAWKDTEDDGLVLLNATDPANVLDAESAGSPQEIQPPLRFARLPSTHAVLCRGRPLLLVEDRGARITVDGSAEPELLQRALRSYLERRHTPRHLVVTTWNGGPIRGSAGEPLLATLGFYASPAGMEWWSRSVPGS